MFRQVNFLFLDGSADPPSEDAALAKTIDPAHLSVLCSFNSKDSPLSNDLPLTEWRREGYPDCWRQVS